jgi:ferric-dicitrate binding protein FerR (iron transport regulator)
MNEESNIEELITKWLDNEISDQELSILKKHKDFQELEKIKNASSQLDYGTYNKEDELERLQTRLKESRVKKRPSMVKWLAAAVLVGVIMTGLYTSQQWSNEIISTPYASLVYQLPDNSSVHLNNNSSISFNKKNWVNERVVQLKGEALFTVQKGASFIVETSRGNVTVLGTQFNVMISDETFKVTCFEGTVSVKSNNKEIILNPTDEVAFNPNGNHVLKQNFTSTPNWINSEFIYDNQSLSKVLIDVSENFNVKVTASIEVENIMFTGGFNKSNLKNALKSIEIPLGLQHKKVNNEIIMTKKK